MRGLNRQEQAVMTALASGRALSDTPDAIVAVLVRHDLARVEAGRLVAREVGRGWNAGTADPSAANRMLAERTLPGRQVGGRRVTVNLAESPLGWLKARGLVDARQYEAGERIRGDWERAQLAPSVTMRWDPAATPGAGGRHAGGGEPGMAQIAARRRFDDAIAAVGPGLSDILWRVMCAGERMEAAEGAMGWPKRSARLVLTLALNRLADHYGLR